MNRYTFFLSLLLTLGTNHTKASHSTEQMPAPRFFFSNIIPTLVENKTVLPGNNITKLPNPTWTSSPIESTKNFSTTNTATRLRTLMFNKLSQKKPSDLPSDIAEAAMPDLPTMPRLSLKAFRSSAHHSLLINLAAGTVVACHKFGKHILTHSNNIPNKTVDIAPYNTALTVY